jgi:hypothetical protein
MADLNKWEDVGRSLITPIPSVAEFVPDIRIYGNLLPDEGARAYPNRAQGVGKSKINLSFE